MKKTVAVTGSRGLVASGFVKDWSHTYDFESIDINDPKNPVDITDKNEVSNFLNQSQAEVVIHCAAYTDVTGAWKQEGDKNGPAYLVNVVGTHNIIEACQKTNKFLIFISTAYVFDGNKPEAYLETDPPNPIEWYGQTKKEAEDLVQASQLSAAILRIDQPFGQIGGNRPDVVARIVTGLKEKTLYPQFDDHYFSPTYLDDLGKIMDWVIRTRTKGLFHATSGEKWSDFKLAQLIKDKFELQTSVEVGKLEDYLKNTNRPYQKNTTLNNQKLVEKLDFKLTPISEAVGLVADAYATSK